MRDEETESTMACCMIYATAGSPEEAKSLARTLVEERLVACVNIVDGVTSIYRWDGNTESDTESILIAKTTTAKRQDAMVRLQALHSYDTPCIVSYDISDGVPEYLNWVMAETEEV